MTTGKENQVDSVTGHLTARIGEDDFVGDVKQLYSYPRDVGSRRFVWTIEGKQEAGTKRTVLVIDYPTKLVPVTDESFEFSKESDSEKTAKAFVVFYNGSQRKQFSSESGNLTVTYFQGALENNRGTFHFVATLGEEEVNVSGEFDLTGRTSADAGSVER